MQSSSITTTSKGPGIPLRTLLARGLTLHCLVGCALTAALIPGITLAADADAAAADEGPQIQEVTVTATRHEEVLSKVPISISAYTQESMDQLGIRDFTDVARYTPGVQIDAGQTNAISIRGISSSGGAGTTGIYIDDTPIQIRAMGFNPDDTLPKTFDMDRVEVLRGPQGTLFGAGSEGGTVRYIMTQPSTTKESGYARAELSYTEGGTANYEAGAAYGAPIIDGTLGFRVSAWYRKDGGWIDRVDPTNPTDIIEANANHDETTLLRGAALWTPTDNVSVTPSIVWQNRERHDLSIYWPLYSNPNSNNFVSANPTAQPDPDQYLLPALKITADFGSMQFISNSSYYRRRDLSGYDGTLYNLSYYQTLGWQGGETSALGTIPASGSGPYAYAGTPYAGSSLPCTGPQGVACYPLLDGNGVHLPAAIANYRSPASVTNNQDNITQEFRLQSNDPNARIVWTVGAFYSLNRTFSLEQIHDPMVDQLFEYLYGTTIANVYGTATNPDGSSYLPMGDSYLNQLTGFDRQLAGFGEVVWGLTDTLKLTTGVRYSKTDFTFNSYSDGPQNGGPVVNGQSVATGVADAPDGQQHEKPLTYRVGLSWQIDPNDLLYATYSTGFRIGGANAAIPFDLCSVDFNKFGIDGNPTSYKSDTVKSYEIGAKNNLDNRLRLATSAYYIKWDNIQQTITLPTCALNYTANVGTAVSEGFDLQADYAVTQHLSLESAIGYNDSHYTATAYPGPLSATPIVDKGDAIVGESATPGAPWTITLGAEYRFPLFERDTYIRIDGEHETKNNRPTAAEDENTVQYAACSTNSGSVQSCAYTPSATTFVSLRAGQEFRGWNISGFIDNLLDTHTTTNYNYQGVDGFGPQIPGPNGTSAPVATPLYRNFTFRPRTFGITATYRY
jgi:iron complex outermembrane receptor protein